VSAGRAVAEADIVVVGSADGDEGQVGRSDMEVVGFAAAAVAVAVAAAAAAAADTALGEETSCCGWAFGAVTVIEVVWGRYQRKEKKDPA
jgi:hypothetical protein